MRSDLNLDNRSKVLWIFPFLIVVIVLYLLFCFLVPEKREKWLEWIPRYYQYSTIVDRTGVPLMTHKEILYDGGDGVKSKDDFKTHYSKDESIRTATVHVIGDPSSNIKSSVITQIRSSMDVDYNIFNGYYHLWWNRNEEIELTISSDLSVYINELLSPYDQAVVLISNYKTGEILACVSKPNFDPNKKGDDSSFSKGAYYNKAFESAYAPGSIFKIVTLCALLEKEEVSFTSYNCDGDAAYYHGEDSTTIVCAGNEAHGKESLQNMLTNSCNCGFSALGNHLGEEEMTSFVNSIGVCSPVMIDSYKSEPGNFSVENDLELVWASVGQGNTEVTPVGYMSFLNAVANSGISVSLHIRKDSEETYEQLLTEQTADTVAEMMNNNVVNNYSRYYSFPLGTCAKTGTAEAGPVDAKYENSWFVGFINNEKTPYSFVVFVERGGAGISTSGKITSQILDYMINLDKLAK